MKLNLNIFHDNELASEKTQCLTYSIILTDSVYKSDKSYCSQKFG